MKQTDKSIYIRQWEWEEVDLRVYRNGKWGELYSTPTPSSRKRLNKLMSSQYGNFERYTSTVGLHSLELIAHDYKVHHD